MESDDLRRESLAYIHDCSILRAFTYVHTSKHMRVCVVVHPTRQWVGRILAVREHL